MRMHRNFMAAVAANLKDFDAELFDCVGVFRKFVCAVSCAERDNRLMFSDEYGIFSRAGQQTL